MTPAVAGAVSVTLTILSAEVCVSCLIVQSDKTLLLEVDHERADDCRKSIAPFAELERSPEHIHTYRLTPLGLWNARAAGDHAPPGIDTPLGFPPDALPPPPPCAPAP